MQRYMLKTTMSSNRVAKSPASFKHNIDELILSLKLRPMILSHSPGRLSLRSPVTQEVRVGDLNQVWRYGAALPTPNNAFQFLEAESGIAWRRERVCTYCKLSVVDV